MSDAKKYRFDSVEGSYFYVIGNDEIIDSMALLHPNYSITEIPPEEEEYEITTQITTIVVAPDKDIAADIFNEMVQENKWDTTYSDVSVRRLG